MQTIEPNDIHLWHTTISDCEPFIHLYTPHLTQNEIDRANQFHFQKDRLRYLITRIFVRWVLTEYEPKVRPKDWLFTTNQYGRPEIMPGFIETPLTFNITHSGNIIALAITSHRAIGVDTEAVRDIPNFMDLAKSHFTQSEFKSISLQPLHLQSKRFFEIWTLKESYIKALGTGLSTDLRSIEFEFTENNLIGFSCPCNQYVFWQFEIEGRYVGALCCQSIESQASKIVIHNKIPVIGTRSQTKLMLVQTNQA